MSVFSSALKSISATNITGNYSISPNATSQAGPWRIHDGKKKSTGKTYSVFIFDRKSLDSHGSQSMRSSGSSSKRAAEEVLERLRKEASSLAKLRHPNILELVEPVEDTRGGGLQFVTEPVTASLASLLSDKDGGAGRSSRYVVEEADGSRRRREFEIDELEIQKGLLQISKALEFLHENAGLVHGNLTPDAVLVNAKSDWKISGLSFCSPAEGSNKPTSIQPISLSEALNIDPRLPRHVQLNLDYTSPDFVLDNNLNSSADMFSLGLLCIALYNTPHRSPLETHQSNSTYKRLFSSSATVPNPSNKYLCKGNLPRELVQHVLPKLITRRPANRLTAKEFQQSEFFDNILVSTIRFLDSFPAKTPGEKSAFLRGLPKVLPSFPKSVMERKLLPALLEEMKDRDLISMILQNVFKIADLLPAAKRAFGERVRPALKEIFVTNVKQPQEKDPARDAGLMVFLEHIKSSADNCSGKEFKDDILPIIVTAIESPTHGLVDAALRGLPVILPVLDFSTIKNELFPVIAAVFARTNSLQIKIRGLRAFVILCGGSPDAADDGLAGIVEKKTSSSTALDKYTMQEKIVPLVKAIKTKEPAVMMAALDVMRVVGHAADADFVAMDLLPILWSMSLGPLLNLKQFQSFMDLIKSLSRRVEDEQTKKLQELSASGDASTTAVPVEDFMGFGGHSSAAFEQANGGGDEDDFERLVKGGVGEMRPSTTFSSWDDNPPVASPSVKSLGGTPKAPAFSWSTPSPTQPTATPSLSAVKAQGSFRTVTPDLGSFGALAPMTTQFSQPLQPAMASQPQSAFAPPPAQNTATNWSASSTVTSNPWSSSSTPMASQTNTSSAFGGVSASMGNLSLGQQQQQRPAMNATSSFSLPPPPSTGSSPGFGVASPSASHAPSFGIPPPAVGGNVWATQPSSGRGSTASGFAGSSSTGMGIGSIGGAPMGSIMGSGASMGSMMGNNLQRQQQQQQQQQGNKSGLDKYQSLL